MMGKAFSKESTTRSRRPATIPWWRNGEAFRTFSLQPQNHWMIMRSWALDTRNCLLKGCSSTQNQSSQPLGTFSSRISWRPREMIRDCIPSLLENQHLTMDQAREAMNEMMSGQATPAQVAAFLVALKKKGETVEEVTALAGAMRQFGRR